MDIKDSPASIEIKEDPATGQIRYVQTRRADEEFKRETDVRYTRLVPRETAFEAAAAQSLAFSLPDAELQASLNRRPCCRCLTDHSR